MVVLQYDGAETVDGHRAIPRIGEIAVIDPVATGDGQPAGGGNEMDFARVRAVVLVVDVLSPAVVVIDGTPVGIHDWQADRSASVIIIAEDDDGGIVVAHELVGPQIQMFDETEVTLRILPVCHAANASGHDDAPALDFHIGNMRAAHHFHRRAYRARCLVDIVDDVCRVGIGRVSALGDGCPRGTGSRNAEIGKPCDIGKLSAAAHNDFAADVLATVGVGVVALVRVVAAGIVLGAHVCAIAGHGGIVDRGGPRRARAVRTMRFIILSLKA